MAIATARHPAGSQSDAEGIMTIRRIAILAVALAALSGCKAVTLQEATVTQPTYGIEAEDWGVPATDELRQDAYHAPTPTTHPTAAVINTQDLHAMLIGPNPPVTINALFGNNQVTSIPGSNWLPAAGQGGCIRRRHPDSVGGDTREHHRRELARPIVVYCVDANCWLSYNAALRFDALGYENLYWYRGGIAAWKAANLPTRMASR